MLNMIKQQMGPGRKCASPGSKQCTTLRRGVPTVLENLLWVAEITSSLRTIPDTSYGGLSFGAKSQIVNLVLHLRSLKDNR